MEIKNIVAVGASAGGLKAIGQLLQSMPGNLPVAFLIVLHMSKKSQAGVIIKMLQKHTDYPCKVAEDGDEIKAGQIYLAPTNQHMLVKTGVLRLVNGPHENRWRPSIDVLFRSAAAAYDSHVTGVILSGLLDDGTAGMSAIKRSGGICIVQDPYEAEYGDMPINVMNSVQVDHRVLVQDIGYIIADNLSKPARNLPIPEDVKIEARINERMVSSIDELKQLGEHSDFTCPDCGGNLFEMKKDPVTRYRCHTGHVYTELTLLERQGEELEESVWISIRMLEERRRLLLNMLERSKDIAGDAVQSDYEHRANELQHHIERLKSFLVSLSKTSLGDEGYL